MNAGDSCGYCWCSSFFGFLRADLSSWGYRNKYFLVALCCYDDKVIKLGSIHQEASLSADKNTRVFLVQSRTWKCVPTAKEPTLYLPVLSHIFNIFWITVILSKGCKPDNLETQNLLKFSFTHICGLSSNFTEFESFLESNSPNILALCETNLDNSIDSGNFCDRISSFKPKDILLLICMILEFMSKKDFLLHKTYP